jgi:CRP-like cAMP-binding protein
MASVIELNNPALYSSIVRQTLYTQDSDQIYVYENPLFSVKGNGDAASIKRNDSATSNAEGKFLGDMRLKDFLASIPSFCDFTDEQLLTLEKRATIEKFKVGDVIFKQGDVGDSFYVIHQGAVDVLISEDVAKKPARKSQIANSNLGKTVNRLSEGFFFGERALMTNETRAASIQVCQENTVCLVFSKAVYEDVISGSSALIGKDINDSVDWSKDHETRSLFRHVQSILEIESKDTSQRIRRVLYELSTAFTPELSADEIIARMVMTVKVAIKADRVGLFVLAGDNRSMILKFSERSKGVRLPVRGLAGSVIQSNEPINIVDAYQDQRFDSTMDRRTGYRTRQVLGVPIRHPVSENVIAILQVNNRIDNNFEAFTSEQQHVVELAAEQLSELLQGRADVFIHAGDGGNAKSMGQGVGDGMTLIKSADVVVPFKIELPPPQLSESDLQLFTNEDYNTIEITASLHLALCKLCDPITIEIPFRAAVNSNVSKRKSTMATNREATRIRNLCKEIVFDIDVRDLPRAARILFRISATKKKKKSILGWAASPVFDFKGCLDSNFEVYLIPGDVLVPINTTISSDKSANTTQVQVFMVHDIVFKVESLTPHVRIVHSMPVRQTPLSRSSESLSAEDNDRLLNIINISFNPLGMNILNEEDKEFLWESRLQILDRAELIPAFVMCICWDDADKVLELYDLLDIWEAPTPIQALMLLDRRFMDPKVRAYAAHALEELSDEDLSLYMLQLCQQLKFENHVDSALSRFLLRRALRNQRLIGHIFFWCLQSEVYNIDVARRYIVLLQIYIRNCGHHRIELGHQMFVMKRLEHVAELVTKGDSKASRLIILRDELRKVVLPSEFQLPLNPHIKVRGIDVERCRVMESKKKPLWLTFKDAPVGGNDIVLMLKVGDDLRQDALIMQLLRVMNDLWRKEGLDMQMKLYDCISTGYERGLLQVVQNASTLGNILLNSTDNKGSGKSGSWSRKISSALKAINDFDVMKEWMWDQVCEDIPSFDDPDAEVRKQAEMERYVLVFFNLIFLF